MVEIDDHIVYGLSVDNEVKVELKEGGCSAEVRVSFKQKCANISGPFPYVVFSIRLQLPLTTSALPLRRG